MEICLQHARERQVLTEEAKLKRPPRFLPPGRVMLRRVAVDGLVWPAVDPQVRLLISIDVEAAHHHGSHHCLLVDRALHRPSVNPESCRTANLNRQNARVRHLSLHSWSGVPKDPATCYSSEIAAITLRAMASSITSTP
jgi:hypothetical protein